MKVYQPFFIYNCKHYVNNIHRVHKYNINDRKNMNNNECKIYTYII